MTHAPVLSSLRWRTCLSAIAATASLCWTQTAPAQPGGMAPVAKEHGYCRRANEAMCYEWKLMADPRQRLVAHGDEDGIEYAFYTLDANRRYVLPVRIHPAIKDPDSSETLFWGYAWDIHDIALGPDGRSIMSTFNHQVMDDGNVSTPSGQRRIPVVLFTGRATQREQTVPLLTFAPMSVRALRADARRLD